MLEPRLQSALNREEPAQDMRRLAGADAGLGDDEIVTDFTATTGSKHVVDTWSYSMVLPRS